jgi:hypothetical protein
MLSSLRSLAGGVLVAAIGCRLCGCCHALFDRHFGLPNKTAIDAPLFFGSPPSP